jgi:phenylalanyl-tRNA synthetase beta chain
MLVGFNWLKEFVETDRSAEEIADLLTMGGIEVEGVSRKGEGLDKVFTAKILEIDTHPSVEKLSLVRIDLSGRETTVVCGAPNVEVGQIVPYVGPGAVLPSGLEISEREIQGVRSPGMICSEKELELGEDEAGILVFDSETPVGVPLTEAIPEVDDFVLETSVTPNRGDCLSILGIARDVAALLGKPWKIPEIPPEDGSVSIHDRVTIEVPDFDLCPRYTARMVEGVKIGPSPFHVRLRLHRSGMRPISNVVDATNLILLECGQPLHAFDYDLLEDARIVVRRADPGERFVTLDNVERIMPENALMIRDGKRAVALAGIMGGLNSEICDGTERVLIESACFEMFATRRTAKALGMSTEASFRFERGVDPAGSLRAVHLAAYLIRKLAGGSVLSGVVDVYPEPIERRTVPVRVKRTNRLLGIDIEKKDMASYLERLGIDVKDEDGDRLSATAPSWRWDLNREVDMAEEIARIHGFQKIPVTMPSYRSAPDRSAEGPDRIRSAGDLMATAGFSEVITMSFVSAKAAEEFAEDGTRALPLINPLTEEIAVMRTSLLPGLLSAMKRNVSFRSEDLRLFEIGKTFVPVAGEELPREDLKLAGLVAGARYPRLWHFQRGEVDERGKIVKRPAADFFDMKGALEILLEGLRVEQVSYEPSKRSFLHPGKSADVLVGGNKIGYIGELSPAKMREHELEAQVSVFEILLEPLFVQSRKDGVFRPLPRYPYVERDLSIIVEEKVSGDAIKRLISRSSHGIIDSVILFDLYQGESIPKGHRSMAFRIRYQCEDRTLTDEEVQEVHSRVLETLAKEVGASLRE